MTQKIIHLISGPRNLSTALMYSFAQRADTTVVDEPFYAHYLVSTGMDHPGGAETIRSMSADTVAIQKSFFEFDKTPVLFLKDMAHHLIDMDLSFLDRVTNLFLIRDPHQLIASFAQVIPTPTMQDIGLAQEWALFEQISQANGKPPVVLDSGDLLADPELMLPKLCAALDLPTDMSMASWPAGARPEDGVWAKYWYKGVHNSTGFARRESSTRELPDQCQPLYQEALPYYQKLSEFAIKL
ncbi:MAG: sulfotransferase family protein [Cyclobacteriaceae bacterium]